MSRTLVVFVLIFAFGCSDPAGTSNDDNQGLDASRLIDRGIPTQPGDDSGIDPERMGTEPQSIETRLQFSATKAGVANLVNCDVRDIDGELIIDLQPVVYVEPDRNILRGVDGLSATTPGEYRVFCALPAYGLSDETPETWTVMNGDPVSVAVSAEPNQASAGDVITVSCSGVDEFGNAFTLSEAEYSISPDSSLIENQGEGRFRIVGAGEYQTSCSYEGLESELSTINVTPGPLAELRASLSPNRLAYRVDELIEVQWAANDRFGNAIETGVTLTLDIPQGGQLVGSSRVRFSIPGRFTVGAIVSDGVATRRQNLDLSIDDGAPSITCVAPAYGTQLQAEEGEFVSITAKVSDELDIPEVYADEQRVELDADGTFTIAVPAVYGPNVVKIMAADEIGERTSRLCGFFAAPTYAESDAFVNSALQLHLAQAALDELNPMPRFSSLGDVLRAFLNSEGLFEAIDDELSQNNGELVPSACRVGAFGVCAFSAGMRYGSLRVAGPNDANLNWRDNGMDGRLRLEGVSVTGAMFGRAFGQDYNTQLGLQTDRIDGDIVVEVVRGANGVVRVTSFDVRNLTVGEIERIDLTPDGGFFDRIVDSFQDAVVWLTDFFFRNQIVGYVESTIENEGRSYLDSLVRTLGTSGLTGIVPLPALDGTSTLNVEWTTSVDGLSITPSGLKLSTRARLSTDQNIRRATLGVPMPPASARAVPTDVTTTAVVADFALVNHALTVLWESGYLDLSEAVVEYLGGVDLVGTEVSVQLLAPPVIYGTSDGKIRVGVGPLEGRGSIPFIGIGDLVFRASATIEGRAGLNVNQELYLTDASVIDFDLALDEVPIGASGTSDFEEGVRDLLTNVINSTLQSFLPSIPIPTFVMPAEYGRFGVPANTRLGLLSADLDVQERDVEFTGEFGELLP